MHHFIYSETVVGVFDDRKSPTQQIAVLIVIDLDMEGVEFMIADIHSILYQTKKWNIAKKKTKWNEEENKNTDKMLSKCYGCAKCQNALYESE